jgi:methyl-accepting chemotaxis protein
LERAIGERLKAIAATAALDIDGDLHDQIKNAGDQDTEAFETIRQHLLEVKQGNDLREEVYTFRRMHGKLEYVVMTNERPFIGDTYTIKEAMLPTLNDGIPTYSGAYVDENGHWISGYAPVLDSNGQVSAMLEVDVRIEEFVALLNQKFIALVIKGMIFAVIAVVLSFLLAGTVTRRINYLTEVTEKISLGKVDTRIYVTGNDEVAQLGASLERMRESLKIAAQLIK